MGLWSDTAAILPGHAKLKLEPLAKELEANLNHLSDKNHDTNTGPPIKSKPLPPPQLIRHSSDWLSQLLTSTPGWPLSTPPQHNRRPSAHSLDIAVDMPSLNGVVASHEEETNGNAQDHNGTTASVLARRPKTPTTSAMALTEYSVCPSPPSETAQARIKQIVPDEFLLPDGYPDYLRMILSATSRIYEACKATPLTHAVNLSNRLECNVLFKREDEQPVFSFKLRGAYNKMAHLDPARSWKGVVCCSAGNHAQGVAYSARKLKIPATIVMPEGTPSIKHTNVARLGGHVVLHGADFDAAKEEAARRAAHDGLINIPPFDDPYVIAGQGTIGNELFAQVNMAKVEAIFCGVGGGGLIAGIGVYVKRMAPHVKIIGVEAHDANAMAQSLRKGERVVLREVGLFADGAAVKSVGEEPFRLAREVVDDVVEVSTDEICAAIKDMYDDTRSGLEPAGALPIAGLKKYAAANPSRDPSRTLIAVTSGANMNFDRLRFVAERATLGEGKEVLLACTIPERPGAFARLVEAVMPRPVTEFSYRRAGGDAANVLLGLSLTAPVAQRADELRRLLARVRDDGTMTVADLSADELAKSHLRYLVGGRAAVPDEKLFMFTFPERPGALERFLLAVRPKFNISLFQYRNYGGDVAKILAGIECPDAELPELLDFLRELGYPFQDCSDSEVYRMFLRT
ncbi:threonine ammonia-lyase precursor [Cordyceps fumosorosea ARSEF 2679]|uniref:Threonine dehydratase n=1 Tax=Cordyceps fumosorosea (strain ARSEF 2679) TaxID=1081104 RepID=A0A167V3B0_CORFA|nr:threonine ammonia-lyase precursor [Cordyceps fumosorosea ARSEF 2679]OAA62188.1 threonine ammonia-lyase precursor [Cordyceps fumosorosea ARSEF 2679]